MVGLSGGVDGFVTALLLKRQGYEVLGVRLNLWDTGGDEGVGDLCRKLDIEPVEFDGRELFRTTVVDDFVKQYIAGRTPNPCVVCNNLIKWNLLLMVADKYGVSRVATGHYVRIVVHGEYYFVCRGVDKVKDQSYFLWGLGQDILSRAVAPLGNYTKQEVRCIAQENGYEALAKKRESMGICFLEGRDYRDFICEYIGGGDLPGEGDVLDVAGCLIGHHSGLLNYTVGQKRGMPLSGDKPLYVSSLNADDNVIVADVKEGLDCSVLRVEKVNVACMDDLEANDVEVMVRGLGLNPKGFAAIEWLPDGILRVKLSSPAWAVAPGQPVAFYRGDRLVGGGFLV